MQKPASSWEITEKEQDPIYQCHDRRPAIKISMSTPACSTATAAAALVATWIAELEAVLAPVDELLLAILPLVELPLDVDELPVAALVAPADVVLLAALLDEEPDPGETKEPPETPPEGTLAFAFIAFALNVAKLSPPLGGFITATIPAWQCWTWPQYNQIGLVSLMLTPKTWLDSPESTGTNPEKMPPLNWLHGPSKAAWMTEWFCG